MLVFEATWPVSVFHPVQSRLFEFYYNDAFFSNSGVPSRVLAPLAGPLPPG